MEQWLELQVEDIAAKRKRDEETSRLGAFMAESSVSHSATGRQRIMNKMEVTGF
jgi:hypothetical protein